MRNPFRPRHDPDRPAPGGIDGRLVDYVRLYPPDTPFYWGQGFNHSLTNVPAINGGQWINQFLPDKEFLVPAGVTLQAYLFPVPSGTSGAFQAQLNGATARPGVGPLTAKIMDAHATALQGMQPAPLNDVAHSWARS